VPADLQKAALHARRRGWRVNLRPVAEWRSLLFFAAVWLALRWLLWPLARLIWLVATTPLEEQGFGHAGSGHHGGEQHWDAHQRSGY